MWKRILLLAVLVGWSVGCLEIQGKHTLYLAPDGTVVWTVLEEEVRFDAMTPESRERLEQEFLDRVASYDHAAAVSLEALYPSSIDARVLRAETPQTILTRAYFPGIDRVYQNLFSLYGAVASAELKIRDDRARLEVVFWLEDEEDEEEIEEGEEDEVDDDDDQPYSDEILLALLSECRIVLTEGKFVDAEGFKIVDGGRAVIPAALDTDEAEEYNTPVKLSLTWTTRE